MAAWWAWFSGTRALPDCLLIAAMAGVGYLWPRRKKPATDAPKPSPRPCSCDAYNGVICRNHAK